MEKFKFWKGNDSLEFQSSKMTKYESDENNIIIEEEYRLIKKKTIVALITWRVELIDLKMTSLFIDEIN